MSTIDIVGNPRHRRLFSILKTILFDLSGAELDELDRLSTFLELGFDSLFLIQMSTAIKGELSVNISFRQLIEELETFESLLEYLDAHVPEDNLPFSHEEVSPTSEEVVAQPELPQAPVSVGVSQVTPTVRSSTNITVSQNGLESLISQQLELMSLQLEALKRGGGASSASTLVNRTIQKTNDAQRSASVSKIIKPEESKKQESKPFGAIAHITRGKTEDLSPVQQKWLDSFIHRYNKRTAHSKAYTEQHRPHMADPRVVTGFKSKIKELIYPIVVDRTEGCHIWDADGNKYVDALNGFGSNFFGYRHPKITQAVVDQLWRGVEIGPQSPAVGNLAKIICDFTGMDRTAFCNTGSEAVMGAMRMARTVTGRSLIVIFNGAYHGIFDEVLVRGTKNLRSVPAAPGILPSSVENVLVLDYGTDEALNIIRERAHELAAVMIEPIQSRRPDLRPREFLHEIRSITEKSGSAFIFDEVITGFRLGPGGAQEYYGIQADIATYGKVIGGGMPIGVMAGKARFMDALDGGAWSYGNDSLPEVGVTYFAGTFVRHPAAMAACQAAMEILQEGGEAIYRKLNEQTSRLCAELNTFCEKVGVPINAESFSSLWRITYTEHVPYSELLFFLMRQNGVHIYDGFPCFLTMAHTDDDVDRIIMACQESIRELQKVELLPNSRTCTHSPDELLSPKPSHDSRDLAYKKSFVYSPQKVVDLKERDQIENSKVNSVSEIRVNQRFPLTEAQMEIWLASQMGDMASCAYNEPFILSLHGPLDLKVLEVTIQEILCRHAALHHRFEGNEAYQKQITPEPIHIPFLDFSSLDSQARLKKKQELFFQAGTTPFNLATGPMVRVHIVKLAVDDHIVMFSAHHIVCDGWSWNVMLGEISKVYSAKIQGRDYQLGPVGSYRSYVENEIKEQKSEKTERSYSYWMKQFSDFPPPLELPIDRARPRVKTYNGATVKHLFDSQLFLAIKKFAAKQKTSLFSFTFSVFNVLLARLSNQYDLVVSIPSAGQLGADTHALVGHCVNLLPVRSRFDSDMSFQQFLVETKTKILDAYDNQNSSLGGIVKRLQIPRDPTRLPLVEINFNLDRDGAAMQFHGLNAAAEQTPKQAVNFDIFFNLNEINGQLRVDIDYNRDLYRPETIQRWLSCYTTLLQGIVDNPDTPIAHLPLLNEEEKQHILVGFNQTEQPCLHNVPVHELIEAQVAQTPTAVALVCGNQRLTYEQLNSQANQLAHYLQEQGVEPGQMVGLCMDRSLEMVVALLAILKSGGTYIPLDPAYPPARIAHILDDAQAAVLITHSSLREQLPDSTAKVVWLDTEWNTIRSLDKTNPSNGSTGEQLAYVIYTSGSTGKPKGVEIPHRALSNLLQSICRKPGLTAHDRLLAVTTISFDIAAVEIYGPLLVGGEVHLASSEDAMDGRRLMDCLRNSNATVMQATPATWQMLVDVGRNEFSQLRMFCGGAVLTRELANSLCAQGAELWNMYGPTETTIYSVIHRVTPGSGLIPIGRPIANTQLYVLDASMQPVPIGIPGELYIGGQGVARGYWGRPDLTKEKFIPDSLNSAKERRLFKTGDQVRCRQDGNIEFLGRMDFQVKIRGFRIELGEIESTLAQHRAIRDVVVIAQEEPSRESRLVAYLVPRLETHPNNEDLRNFLGNTLPLYMIPSSFVWLDSLPLTPNGKIDRAKLSAEERTSSELQHTSLAPRTPLESQLKTTWEKVFGKYPIGVMDNFFDLGGESLLAVHLALEIEKTLHTKISIPTIFQAQTIAQLAKLIEKDREEANKWSWLVPIQTSGSNPPLFCILFGNTFRPYIKNNPEQPLYMFFNQGHDGLPARYDTVEELAAQYVKDMQQVQPNGPYYLSGYSFGGLVAYEMARQLHQQGDTVEFLALVDPTTPLPLSTKPRWADTFTKIFRKQQNNKGSSYPNEVTVSSLVSRISQALVWRTQQLTSLSQFKMMVCKTYFRLGYPLHQSLRQFYRDTIVSEMSKHYHHQPYPGDIILFQSDEQLESYWGKLCGRIIQIYELPIGHLEITDEPYVENLYKQLMNCLQQIQGRQEMESDQESTTGRKK